MFRGYDSNALWRHDEIIRIRHLEAEIADMQKDIERQKENAVAAGEGFQRTKTWLGVIDPPKRLWVLVTNTPAGALRV